VKWTCEEANRQLETFVDGELRDGARAQVEAHLDGCERCRRDAQALRELREALRKAEADATLTPGEAAAFEPAVRARIREAEAAAERHSLGGLARAFATEPKVLLLDEPFAQIDALTRGVIQEELMRMWTASRNTVFMVTHDVDEAILLSDRIALMTNGPDARLAEILEVKIPRPRSRGTIIDEPEYGRLRSHIIHFLVERSRLIQAEAIAKGD